MGDSARRFVSRATRYVLRPQDRKIMRFSLEHTQGEGGIEETRLLNLSETGCAFLVNVGYEPRISERIKVEIPIPGGDQIAWWARVVRVQHYEPKSWGTHDDRFKVGHHVFVALKFEPLPQPHSRAIRRGINQSFMQAMRDQQYKTWVYYRNSLLENVGKAMLGLLLFAALVWFIYHFTRGDDNYDPKRGAQWGERFKF